MEGIYFYWFSWIGWVYITFLMRKSTERTILTVFILVIIIFSNSNYRLYEHSIGLSYTCLLIFSIFYMSKTKGSKLLYYLICSLILAIAYCCFHLFELFDPIWLLFDRRWMLAFVLLYLLLMLVKEFYYRISVAVIGICKGELLYYLIFRNFSFPIEIGDFRFLDVAAVYIFLIAIWSSLEKMAELFEDSFQKGRARRIQ